MQSRVRAWSAYKYSVEHSVYVYSRFRGMGLGEALMRVSIERARANQTHVMIGGIDAANQDSIRLHEKLGFAHADAPPASRRLPPRNWPLRGSGPALGRGE